MRACGSAPPPRRLAWSTGLVFGETRTLPFGHRKATRRAHSDWDNARLTDLYQARGNCKQLGFHAARHSFRSYLDAIPTISETRADRHQGTTPARYGRGTRTHSTFRLPPTRPAWTRTDGRDRAGEA
jgi:hypothetical protein